MSQRTYKRRTPNKLNSEKDIAAFALYYLEIHAECDKLNTKLLHLLSRIRDNSDFFALHPVTRYNVIRHTDRWISAAKSNCLRIARYLQNMHPYYISEIVRGLAKPKKPTQEPPPEMTNKFKLE